MKMLFNLSKVFILLVTSMAIAHTASAAQKCVSWGCAEITHIYIDPYIGAPIKIKGWTDDVLTDGYCVYIRYRKNGQSWSGTSIPTSKSCGARVYFDHNTGNSTGIGGIRLYRDNGNYTTVYGS